MPAVGSRLRALADGSLWTMIPSIRVLALLVLFIFLIFGEAISPIEAQGEISSLEASYDFLGSSYNPVRVRYWTVTAYSSSFDETDDTPFVTADGTFVQDGIAASNCLPLNTIIRIPTLFGNKLIRIKDRMNVRYVAENQGCRIDVWRPTKWEALHFGLYPSTLIEILE